MPVYINRKDRYNRETVDEFETRKEARAALSEYVLADRSGHYWVSSRAWKGWKEDKAAAHAFAYGG